MFNSKKSTKRGIGAIVEIVIALVLMVIIGGIAISQYDQTKKTASATAAAESMRSSYTAISNADTEDGGYVDDYANGILVYNDGSSRYFYAMTVVNGAIVEDKAVLFEVKDKDGKLSTNEDDIMWWAEETLGYVFNFDDAGSVAVGGNNEMKLYGTGDLNDYENVEILRNFTKANAYSGESATYAAFKSTLADVEKDMTANVTFYNAGRIEMLKVADKGTTDHVMPA